MMSLKAYSTWLNKAKKNDRVTYYKSYDADLVILIQKKHADFDYEYMAVRK